MNVFVDTSALLALLMENDQNHLAAVRTLHRFRDQNDSLGSSNYVVVETISLLQRRFGMTIVQAFVDKFLPLLQVEWIDEDTHRVALQSLLVAKRRSLSLVDCSSFVMMHRLGLSVAFVFDQHFEEQGFTCLP
jgi:predicted nucleic acid-binding protein